MTDLQQIAYSHQHDHEFEWTLEPAEDGSNYEVCTDDYCTAIRVHGVVGYDNEGPEA